MLDVVPRGLACQSGVWRAAVAGAGATFFWQRDDGSCAMPNGALGCACSSGEVATRLTGLNFAIQGTIKNHAYICTTSTASLVYTSRDSYRPASGKYEGLGRPGSCWELYPRDQLVDCSCGLRNKTVVWIDINYPANIVAGRGDYYNGATILFLCK